MRPVLIVVLLPLMLLAASLSGARELARHEGIRLNVKDLINFNHTEHSGFTVLIPEWWHRGRTWGRWPHRAREPAQGALW